MLDHTALFNYASHVDPRTVRARTLVVTLNSFLDAGHAQRLIDDHLVNTLSSHRLGTFDADQVMSYRDQRPSIVFSSDHFEQYSAPELVLHEVKDTNGTSFLLLSGPEPGLKWEKMAESIAGIIDRHDVELTMIVQSMPIAVPHTRPVNVSAWASKSELIEGNRPMFGRVSMSSSFPAMLSIRLGDAGHDVIGLTAHVPHYLAENDYPETAIALVDRVRRMTGLDIPTVQLAVAAGVVRAQIAKQVEESEELTQHVEALEEGYDEFARRREVAAVEEVDLPSAEELGDAAEAFLQGLGATETPDVEPGIEPSIELAPEDGDGPDAPGNA